MNTYEEMFTRATNDLKNRYQDGAFAYAKQKYPDFSEKSLQLHKELTEAWKQPDVGRFREVLKRWYLLHRKIFDEYKREKGEVVNYDAED